MNTDTPRSHRTFNPSVAILIVAALIHIGMLLSLRVGYLNPLFDDAMHRSGQGVDFFAVYQAGQNVVDGVNIYSTKPKQQVVPFYNPYRYHPFVAYSVGIVVIVFRPYVAYALWILLQEVLFLVNIGLTRSLFKDERHANIAAGIWLLFSPYYLELYMGQFSFVMTTLIFWTLRAWINGRNARGDSLWTLSLVVKSNSVLFAPVLLMHHRWKTVVLAGAVSVILAVPYFLGVPGSYHDFARNYAEPITTPTLFGNQGFAALLGIVILRSSGLWTDYVQEFIPRTEKMNEMIEAPLMIWMLIVLGISLYLTLRVSRGRILELFLLWILAYFLFYKHVWEHQYVMLLPVFAILYYRIKEGNLRIHPTLFWVLFAVIALPTFFVFIDQSPVLFDPEIAWKPWESLMFHFPKPLAVLVLYTTLALTIMRYPVHHPDRDPQPMPKVL